MATTPVLTAVDSGGKRRGLSPRGVGDTGDGDFNRLVVVGRSVSAVAGCCTAEDERSLILGW